MTNYEHLFQHYMDDSQFAQAYSDARLERVFDEMLNTLKEKISDDAPKDVVLKEIDAMQQQLHVTVDHLSYSTPSKRAVIP